MATETDERELDARTEEIPDDGVNGTEDALKAGKYAERNAPRRPVPWIGALPNPHVGAMVVLNDGGYLVPLFTAGDLLRGCRYYWRAAQE